MSKPFQNAVILQKFWNELSEAVPYINSQYSKNGTLCLRVENPSPIFLQEKNTVFLGNKFSVYIKGFAVSFSAYLEISNKTLKGEVALYFDEPSNNPDFIDLLNNHTGWEHSRRKNVTNGCRLVYKKGTKFNTVDWFNFINEPLEVLLQ